MNIEGNPTLALLILVGLIALVNGMMFIVARAATRSSKANRRVMDSLRDATSKPFQKEDKSLDDLRKRVDELKK